MEEICEAARERVDTPVPQDTPVPAKEVFTAPNGVYGNYMETSVGVQSYQLASCLGVVAAETGGSAAPGRVLGEDTATLAVPRHPLLQPCGPLGACCLWGWLRALLRGGSGHLTRQQPQLCCVNGSHRW